MIYRRFPNEEEFVEKYGQAAWNATKTGNRTREQYVLEFSSEAWNDLGYFERMGVLWNEQYAKDAMESASRMIREEHYRIYGHTPVLDIFKESSEDTNPDDSNKIDPASMRILQAGFEATTDAYVCPENVELFLENKE